MRYKNVIFLEVLNMYKRHQTLQIFKKLILGIHMGPKITTTNI